METLDKTGTQSINEDLAINRAMLSTLLDTYDKIHKKAEDIAVVEREIISQINDVKADIRAIEESLVPAN